MGCAASSIDNEEKVIVCRQRKRLMKKLLNFRRDFADSQLAYLRALRNTGVTLRQFTESESLNLENTSYASSLPLPPSPPPTLPPSPPPPPPFSPDHKHEIVDEEEAEINPLPPPPLPNSWNLWNPFDSLELHNTQIDLKKKGKVGQDEDFEEENWAETKTEFEEEDNEQQEEEGSDDMKKPRRRKVGEVIDDNSSITSLFGKDMRSRNLEGIIRELDDYFLKASGCEKEIAVIIDINSKDTIDPFRYQQETRSKSLNLDASHKHILPPPFKD